MADSHTSPVQNKDTVIGPTGKLDPIAEQTTVAPKPAGRFRWTVCAFVFAATSINYIDRQVLAVLAPTLQHVIGWDERGYAHIIAAFQIAYAIGLTVTGRLIDKFGTRVGYALVIGTWSLAAMSHSLASTVATFTIARFALGLGESGNFPAAIKTVAEWFPRQERSSATGIFNAGSNIGAIAAPIIVPFLTVRYGWRSAFLFTGVLSMTWLAAWLLKYRTPENQPELSSEELAYIRAGRGELESAITPRWTELFRYRQTWVYATCKFVTDPVWWFFLYWLPKFLNHTYGLTLSGLGLPLVTIFVLSDLGSIGGGWLPGSLIRRGLPIHRGRKLAMLVCALFAVPISLVAHLHGEWIVVVLIGLAAAGHQGFSANLYTIASDMFPTSAVGGVAGIGGTAGALGGVLLSFLAGEVLQKSGHYWPLFAYASIAYLLALAIVQLAVPRLQRIRLKDTPAA